MKTTVHLSDEVLLLLDGKADDKTQSLIESVKRRIEMSKRLQLVTPDQAAFISGVVDYAKANGILRLQYTRASRCGVCKRFGGYKKFKTGPRRGRDNYDRPILLSGIQMSAGFVLFKDTFNLGCCDECWSVVKAPLLEELSNVQAELPEGLTGVPPKFKKYNNRKCNNCGWTGSERLMRKERTLMGDGWYPAYCPQCSSKNPIFGPTIIESASGFEIYPVEQSK